MLLNIRNVGGLRCKLFQVITYATVTADSPLGKVDATDSARQDLERKAEINIGEVSVCFQANRVLTFFVSVDYVC